MNGSRAARRLILVVLLLAGGTSVATPAKAAKGPVRYTHASAKVPDGATGSASKACPKNTVAVAGGAAIEGLPGIVGIMSTYPNNVGTGWIAGAFNSSGEKQKVTSSGICAAFGTNIASTVSVSAGTRGTAKASCPAGERAMTGGGTTNAGAIVSSLPADGSDGDSDLDDAWEAQATNPTGSPSSLTAFAACVTETAVPLLWYVNSSLHTVADGETKELSNECPDDTKLLGGASTIMSTSIAIELAKSAPSKHNVGWTTVWRNHSGVTGKLANISICLPV